MENAWVPQSWLARKRLARKRLARKRLVKTGLASTGLANKGVAQASRRTELAGQVSHWLGRTVFNVESLGAWLEPMVQLVAPTWIAGQYRARVVELRPESADIYTLRLLVATSWKGFLPGQFVGLTIEKEGARLTRYFSISSAPSLWHESGMIELTIRRQPGGSVTNWIPEHLYAGSRISLTAAAGDFTLKTIQAPALFIAGGSGITPFRSMLHDLAQRRTGVDVHLLYYCDGDTHLFTQEWAKLPFQSPGIKVSLINALTQGRFGVAHLLEFVPDYHQRDIYVCGPSPMIAAVRQTLKKDGVSEDRVFFEFFGAAPLPTSDEAGEGFRGVMVRAVFQRSGQVVDGTADKPATLLDMAESIGLKPVTGCRMGVCHQCICQKSSGSVLNTLTGKVSDNGAGEVQLCVSVPVTDVTLDL